MGSPVYIGDFSGAVDSNQAGAITGDFVDIFAEDNDDLYTITTGATYGVATIDLNTGTWSYDLNNSDPAVSGLADGATLSDSFVIRVEDTAGTGAGNVTNLTVNITITGVPCFTAGTLIETDLGLYPIEAISVGDRVRTENGYLPVKWHGRRVISQAELCDSPKLYPIKISEGALGNGLPHRDMWVSRQHRMLVSSKMAKRMFGADEVLIPAIKLTKMPGIYEDRSVRAVEYHHLMFEGHEIIFAEGAPTESLLNGQEAMKTLGPEQRAEIDAIFPERKNRPCEIVPARPIPHNKYQKQLIERMAQDEMPLLDELVSFDLAL